MIVDLAEGHALPEDAEVVIVGGGTVALVMGVLLARRGIRTVLLESGGYGFESHSQELNDAATLGKAHNGLSDARARVLGGTSTLWGGQLARFRREDFARRPGVADAPWPIDYDDLQPHYDAVARLLSLSPRLDDDAAVAARLLGADVPDFGAFELIFTRWLNEPNLFRYFRKELVASPTLRVCLHAHVPGLVRRPGRSDIESVRVAAPDGRVLELRAPIVVLANGTIEIARTLLVAAQADPGVPWATNPWVGASFQDHLDLRAARVRVTDARRFPDLFQNSVLDGQKHQPKLRLAAANDARSSVHIACSFNYESSLGEHLQYAKVLVKSMRRGRLPHNLSEWTQHARGIAKVWWPMVSRYVRHHRIYNPADRGVFLTLHCEQAPCRQSRITLDAGRRDRFGTPQAALDWRVSGTIEVDSMRDFVLRLDAQLRAAGLAELDIDPELQAGDLRVLDKAYDSFHQCGGARMGHDASDGVVDAQLRVFGTSNLFVAGAATYRTSSYANPTFTAMALGARLVDTLSEVTA